MAIVRGDRIGMSDKLAKCSVHARHAYPLFISAVPDDFGRFRVLITQIVGRLEPRLEEPRKISREAKRWRAYMVEYETAGLLRTWTEDGVLMAEMSGWKPSGKRYHRTPEPPWSEHQHDAFCARSAVSSLRHARRHADADALSRQFNNFQRQRSLGASSGEASEPPPPSLPSHSSRDKQTVPPPAAEPAKPRGGWVGRVLDLWPGVVDGGHVGKVLKPVVAKYGEAPTLEGLKRWLEAGKAAFGPEVFAREAEAWIAGRPPARAAPGRASAASVTVNAMHQILSEEAAKADDRQGEIHIGAGGDGAPAQQAGRAGAPRRLPPGVG